MKTKAKEIVEIEDEDIIKYIQAEYWPEDVFNESDLAAWARAHGWKKKDEA